MDTRQSCLCGGGDAGERLRAINWANNALGPVEGWPLSLQASVRLVLSSKFPMMIHWGPELITIYNDAYAPSLGSKHPGNLGRPAYEWWSEMWDQLTPIFDQVLAGQAYYVEDACYTPDRDGSKKEAYFTHCHSPLWDDDGQVAGIFLVVTETTRRVLAERGMVRTNASLRKSEQSQRLRVELGDAIRSLPSADRIQEQTCRLLGGHFGAARVQYAELEFEDGQVIVPEGQSFGRPNPVGRAQLGAFPTLATVCQAGRSFVVCDLTHAAEVSAAESAAFAAQGAAAILVSPIMRHGRPAALLAIHHSEPHQWLPDEIALVEEVAERSWVAVERARAEQRVAESEAYWRSLFERLNEGFMVVEVVRDGDGVARTWRFAEINDAWERISGLPRARAIGRPVDEVIPGVEREWIDCYIRIAETGEPQTFRMPLQVLGQVYDIRASKVAPDRVGVLFQEISAQQRAETRRSALLELTDRLRELEAPEDIAFVTARTVGLGLGAQHAGYATVDELGKTVSIARDWTGPGTASRAGLHRLDIRNGAIAALRDGKVVIVDDTTRDPRTLDGLADFGADAGRAFVALPIVEGGHLVAFFFVISHLPRSWEPEELAFIRSVAEHTHVAIERRRVERELRRVNASLEQRVAEELFNRGKVEEQLRQSQKLEAVGQLTGGVAHDFNNLLTVIRSSADLLKRPTLTDERRARYISAISDTVDRAAKLTGQLLAFARRQALQPAVFAVCDSVRALSEMMATLTGPRITIATIFPPEPCFVHADPSQFDTALVNMAVNARDAMDGVGRLTITVEAVDLLPSVRAHPAVQGAYVSVSLTDTGAGIEPDRLERIFEPFFTTKETGKGTGLGLSQVFGFAKQSGGEITVASTPGQGTTFTLYLPRVPARLERTAEAEPEALIDGHGTRVLVVEDNSDVGSFAVQTLSDLGYATVLAADAEAALAHLARDADAFDVVFTDVVMPGMNGIELGREIRRRHGGLPVVLTSGYSQVLAQNGTDGFELLQKPYSVGQLSSVLRKVTARRRRQQTEVAPVSPTAE